MSSSRYQDEGEAWYIAQLKPGGLERAITNLKRQGYESFMPLREETRRRAGRWNTKLSPLFPGYLFIKVPDARRQWRTLNSTYGVSRLVSLESGHPTRVPSDIIAGLQVGCSEDGQVESPAKLKVGDQVRVVSGPLTDSLAEIEAIPEQGRIYVLLELMGRYSKACLSVANVERAEPDALAKG